MIGLRRDRRSFFVRAWAIYAIAFSALLGIVAFAPGIAAKRPVPGLSVGIILALSYVTVVMALSAWYVRRARHWDELAGEVLTDSNNGGVVTEHAGV
jgi:uncharacterized membrane protein (DUF485 family)